MTKMTADRGMKELVGWHTKKYWAAQVDRSEPTFMRWMNRVGMPRRRMYGTVWFKDEHMAYLMDHGCAPPTERRVARRAAGAP